MEQNGEESSVGESPPLEETNKEPQADHDDANSKFQEQTETADTANINGTVDKSLDSEELKSCTEENKVGGDEPRPPVPKLADSDSETETSSSNHNPRDGKWSEALKAKLFASVDKESNFFSYMFLDKIFGEARPCRFCGARGTAKLPPGDDSLKLCVLEDGIVGRQNVLCTRCGEIDTVISCEDRKRFPNDDRLSITGSEIRSYCRKITHYEILHDLMEMLHIAATDNDSQRQEKHHEVADFMLKNVRKVCEEWCRPEYAELRLKKYLRLRDETLLTTYNPTFTPDCTEEYKEMYEMMANSFRQNRDKVLLLLQLMKESLIDSPTRSTFMMWVSIAMMHSESYSQFKAVYDPRSFMRVDSSEYQALQDRYLALEVPLGIKKIPVIFILFEIPRFYHYVEFLNQRLVKKKGRSYLSEEERETLRRIEEETMKMGLKMKPRTGKMVSPEAHLDFLTRQEEYGREMIYQSCRDKEKAKQQKIHNALKAATSKGKHASSNTSDGSSSPSSARKAESPKTSSISSSKDSPSQGSGKSTPSNGSNEKDRLSAGGSEGTRPVSNKKKRKKNRNANSESDAPSPLPVDDQLKKGEEDAIKRRDEFISNDDFHAILRKSVAEGEARRGVVTDGGGGGAGKKKNRHKKRSKKESKEKDANREERCAGKENKDEVRRDKEEEWKKKAGEDGDGKKKSDKSEEADSKKDTSLPRAFKPEVDPSSPLANISLPPQEGADPNRKPISLPSMEPTSTSASPKKLHTTRSALKKELREHIKAHRRHKRSGRDSETVLCAQVDTEMLRAQGYKVNSTSPVTTVIANRDGTIEHILDGLDTPEEVKSFLSRKYSILNQHAGSGYLTAPSKNNPGALVTDLHGEPDIRSPLNPFVNSAAKFGKPNSEPKMVGNPKKRKKMKLAQQEGAISELMDCYAQQRKQSQPGGWKHEMGRSDGVEPGAMDDTMCDVLGGGDLKKALSTAFKGAMAKRGEKREEASGDVSEGGVGWSSIGSYRINSDGSVVDVDIKSCDQRGSGSNSDCSMDMDSDSESSSPSFDESGRGKLEKYRTSSTGSDKSGSGTSKSGSGSTSEDKSGSGQVKLEEASESGAAKDEKSGSGTTKEESGTTKDDQSANDATKDDQSESGATKNDQSGSSATNDGKSRSDKDDKSGSGSAKDIEGGCGSTNSDKSGSGSTKDSKEDESESGLTKDDKSGSGSTKDDKSGSGLSTKEDRSDSSTIKDAKSGSGSAKDDKGGSGTTNSRSGPTKDDINKSGVAKDNKSGSGTTKSGSGPIKDIVKREPMKVEKSKSSAFSRDRKRGSGVSGGGVSRAMVSARSQSSALARRGYYRGVDGMRFLKRPVKDKYCVANPDDLIPDGLMSTAKWSATKKDLFKNCMCRGLDEKVYTVDSEDAARELFLQAMRPTDLGKLEGPCPRYVVPSDGGVGHLTGRFKLPDMGRDIRDLDDFLRTPAAPRQQMTMLDAMRFPYKLETTKVYIHRWDDHGHPMPDKVTMVSKVTMLPKELADRYCCVGDAGSIMELTDTEDDEDLYSATTIDDDREKMLEIEAPPSKADPPPTVITAGEVEFDTPSDMAVGTLSRLISDSLSKNTLLKDLPISVESISKSIMSMLKEPQSSAEMIRPSIEDDDEPGITLPDSSSSKKSSKKKKVKKKPKKIKPAAIIVTTDRRAPSPRHDVDEPPVSIKELEDVGVVDTPPVTPSVPTTTSISSSSTTATPASVATATSSSIRDIDDIDDLDIGVSEDLLRGKGIGGVVATPIAMPSASTVTPTATSSNDKSSRTSQSRVVAREKFRVCENCTSMIDERILVCSGCKKVAYCDRKCQKAHWKSHKRICSHKASKEDCTG